MSSIIIKIVGRKFILLLKNKKSFSTVILVETEKYEEHKIVVLALYTGNSYSFSFILNVGMSEHEIILFCQTHC